MSEAVGFRAMGCDVVVGGASPSAMRAIRALFAERERVFSRFLDDSELSRVNRSPARVVHVSPVFAATLRRALVAARLTGGLVDPTLGAALVRAGYDRDFAALRRPPAGTAAAAEPAAGAAVAERPCSRLHDVRLAGHFLSRPPGLVLDLNGVVKALAVDDALACLDRPGFVSAGGDLTVRGPAVVALPTSTATSPAPGRAGATDAAPVVQVDHGGMATSGVSVRRWLHGDAVRHHLIDPATWLPSNAPWECVTVLAGTCHHADVAAKAAFLAGADGSAWLDARGLAGRFLRPDGSVLANAAWTRALEALPATHANASEESPCT